jgi:signal transduction histidine kinase
MPSIGRTGSLSVVVQVALLVAVAVVMSQAVAFGVVVLAPEPRPQGFSIDAASRALKGETVQTTDGKTLRRRIADDPVTRDRGGPGDPLTLTLEAALARKLGTTSERVRISMERGRPRFGPPRGPGGPGGPPGPSQPFGPGGRIFVRPDGSNSETVVVNTTRTRSGAETETRSATVRTTNPDTDGAGPPANITFHRVQGPAGAVPTTSVQQLTILTDRLTFAPFTASFQQPDGRWAIVEPPHGLLSPSQVRLLLSMVISMLLLAPLVWIMARRLTRPIRVFAEAAERLGADPDAEPLEPSGPSEVRTAIAAFNDMQASLRDHIRRRTQTVAAIAHDLRTPLTRLRFRAEQAPDALRDRMAADVEEMDALIAQAMAYVRGEAPSERRERLDLTELTQACATSFSDTGEPVAFEAGRPMAVLADPAALRRALANLIGNAVKYAGSARVSTLLEDGQAVVTVEDDGPGLADADLDALFEPFARGERSRNRETGGAGLGLTVARQVARAHGGDVVLIPRAEEGLTARLSLPLA